MFCASRVRRWPEQTVPVKPPISMTVVGPLHALAVMTDLRNDIANSQHGLSKECPFRTYCKNFVGWQQKPPPALLQVMEHALHSSVIPAAGSWLSGTKAELQSTSGSTIPKSHVLQELVKMA